MGRYLFTKEGAAEAMGITDISAITKKIQEIESYGFVAYQEKGGIKYYDLDLLMGDWPTDKKLCQEIRRQQKKQTADKKSKLQLSFDDIL